MELLKIQNFLNIHEARLEVSRFTLLIGPQASGKSVIAKLLYFFQNCLSDLYLKSIENQGTLEQFKKLTIIHFEQIFPRYAWGDQEFKLSYSTENINLSLIQKKYSSKKLKIKFAYSRNLVDFYEKVKKEYGNKLEESKNIKNLYDFRQILFISDLLIKFISNSELGNDFRTAFFIPASRSFFATLQKNVFSFLANDLAIDPLIKEFGSFYELSKSIYKKNSLFFDDAQDLFTLHSNKQDIEKILVGQYVHDEDQDWIVSDKRRINLINASSGQQEVLPLLVVLSSWLFFGKKSTSHPKTTFFIEEPEAHLFPLSQKHLVGLFSRFYKYGYNFLLTTHSPYILTALNNLIMASNLVQEKRNGIQAKVKKIIGSAESIQFEDVAAYTIENGTLKSILNKESRLIGVSVIDSVSDEFDHVFDKLIEMQIH